MRTSSPTFVVLGLLAKRPGSGYDLSAVADQSLRYFWPISRTQLYNELTHLEELAWVSGTVVHQDRYPNKRVFEPTPAGMTALREWLDASPPARGQRNHDDTVLRTFLGAFMSPDRLADQLRDHRAQAEKRRAELLAVIGHLDSKESTVTRRFGRATARYGVLQAEATIAWTEEVQAVLDAERSPQAR